VDNVRQVFLVLHFFPVTIIPPMLNTHIHLHAVLTRTVTGCSLRVIKAMFCRMCSQILLLFSAFKGLGVLQ